MFKQIAHLLKHTGGPAVSKNTLAFEVGLRSYASVGKIQRPKFEVINSKKSPVIGKVVT